MIIIYCSLFCERVAFIFDIMLFLAHQYLGETTATATKKTLMDQLTGVSRNHFLGMKSLKSVEARVQGFTSLTESYLDKHNFVTFDILISPQPIQHLLSHPVAIMCKIIPRTEQH